MRKSAKGLLLLPITPWCFALVVAVLCSCGKGGLTAKGVLPEQKMLELLSDIYVVEQKVNTLGLKRDTADLVFEKLKDKVFEKAGITDSIFRLSLDYYIDRPKIMEGIYSQLVDSMNLREQRILSGQPK